MLPDYRAFDAPRHLDSPDPSREKRAAANVDALDRTQPTRRNRSPPKPGGQAEERGQCRRREYELRGHGIQFRPKPALRFGQDIEPRFKGRGHLCIHDTSPQGSVSWCGRLTHRRPCTASNLALDKNETHNGLTFMSMSSFMRRAAEPQSLRPAKPHMRGPAECLPVPDMDTRRGLSVRVARSNETDHHATRDAHSTKQGLPLITSGLRVIRSRPMSRTLVVYRRRC
jgi:hypothetical protein